jgi:hypothetical protein
MFNKMKVRGYPNIYFMVSKNPLKKYDAYDKKTNKKIASFGSRLHEHFFDKIQAFSALNHLDKERRRRYYLRHGKKATKYSPKWFSHHMLW